MSRRLGEMTTVEAGESAAAGDVVILPVGAFEQHGPGLPLATDQIRAEAVTDLVADRLTDRVVIGPAVPVGVSPHHSGFAGTVTLPPSLFTAVLRAYVDSLAAAGWRRFLVINGHGGNNAALGTLAQELLHEHPDLEFAWTPLTSVAADVVASMDVDEVHGHCGEAETAQMMHVAPHLVRHDRLTTGTTKLADLDPLSRLSRRSGHPTLTVRYDRLSPIGVLGDPTRASPEDGRRIVETVVDRITAFVEEWLDT
ncbi:MULTISPECIES: creatininase family protein [unclassified Nocardioides]|uniref:creatininase family protein n=1 Tax=unclassified Nocardioides TaxID=2615069 RepID=UPI0006FB71D5|nr:MULTISPECIES: creatininase family protein [unclassified Nocardioides]KQY57339.1 creatinine amidohydrolase [Nocardioides sp. Root140]KRF20468.1 creatinine amidohydrolase [Nocardioides sp. Soil796]